MNERYLNVFAPPPNLYAEGSPVIIAAGALLRDNLTGGVLAQLKLRNIRSKMIKAVSVRLSPLDTLSNPLGEPQMYHYLDLYANRGQDFGTKTPLLLPDATTRAFTVEVTEVIFLDNTVWQSDNKPWEVLSGPPKAHDVIQSNELFNEYNKTFGKQAHYAFTERKDLWFCCCGALNTAEETICHKCQLPSDTQRITPELFDRLQASILERKERVRKEQEEYQRLQAERQRQIEEERQRMAEVRIALEKQKQEKREKNKKKRKRILITLLVLVILAIVGTFGTLIAIDMIETEKANQAAYDAALFEYEQGNFDEAMNKFAALGNYKDSSEQYRIVEEAKNADLYQRAIEAASNANFSEAEKIFKELGDYKDSKEKLDNLQEIWNEARYQEAIQMIEDGKYERAYTLFVKIGDYKDAKEYASRFYTETIPSVGGGTRELWYYKEP